MSVEELTRCKTDGQKQRWRREELASSGIHGLHGLGYLVNSSVWNDYWVNDTALPLVLSSVHAYSDTTTKPSKIRVNDPANGIRPMCSVDFEWQPLFKLIACPRKVSDVISQSYVRVLLMRKPRMIFCNQLAPVNAIFNILGVHCEVL